VEKAKIVSAQHDEIAAKTCAAARMAAIYCYSFLSLLAWSALLLLPKLVWFMASAINRYIHADEAQVAHRNQHQ